MELAPPGQLGLLAWLQNHRSPAATQDSEKLTSRDRVGHGCVQSWRQRWAVQRLAPKTRRRATIADNLEFTY